MEAVESEIREQVGRHFRSGVDSMKGLSGYGQCLKMPLTARDRVKMPNRHWSQRTETVGLVRKWRSCPHRIDNGINKHR